MNSNLPFGIAWISGLSGALPGGLMRKKSPLPGRKSDGVFQAQGSNSNIDQAPTMFQGVCFPYWCFFPLNQFIIYRLYYF